MAAGLKGRGYSVNSRIAKVACGRLRPADRESWCHTGLRAAGGPPIEQEKEFAHFDFARNVFAAAFAIPAFAQTLAPEAGTAADQSHPAAAPETVTGRITKLDTKARTFSVRAGDTGRTVDLRAIRSVNVSHLRRGERVIVTHAGGIALKVQATRDLR